MGRTRRTTRRSIRLDDIGIHTTRRRSRNEEIEVPDDARNEINGEVKENGLLRRVNGRLRRSKNDKEEDGVGVNVNGEAVKREESVVENGEQGEDEKENENGDDKQDNSSENEEIKKTRTRRTVNHRTVGKISNFLYIYF